jgi:PfaB family protein
MNPNLPHSPIAVVGLSCLFPGAATPDDFWRNLINGVDSTSPATAAQFGVDPAIYHDPARRTADTTYFLRGGFVTTQVDIPEGMDKASGWSLYVAREALKDAGLSDRADVLARCGVILGNLSFPTPESHQRIAPIYDAALSDAIGELLGVDGFELPREHRLNLGTPEVSPAAEVAHRLGLGGTHFALDAACASSLYAVGLACAMLNAGKADLMLAGAVAAADPLFVNMGFTHFGAYPERGASRPLDAKSEGLVSGEGAGILALKRYDDAVRDGDRIHAVIAGVGLSNDGRGKHPLTPNPRGQVIAFQRAYASGVAPQTVQYVECHASGTPLGDKTELGSMDEFFGAAGGKPLIGSVKANHGHLLTVAGLASMLKVILSMTHGQIPPTIGVEAPLSCGRMSTGQIVTQVTPWPDGPRVAGVNAFGFGGVSAHMVLSQQQPVSSLQQGQTTLTNQRTEDSQRAGLAIVGMDAQFGGVEDLDAFEQTIYDGTQHFGPLPQKRWKGLADDAPNGAYLESFEIDFLRFKFPPKEDDQPTPQHLLLLKVADNAVRDAKLAEGANVAVIVAMGTELSLHQYRGRLDLSWQLKDGLRRAGVEVDANALGEAAKSAISPLAQVNQYTSYIGNIVSSRVSALWNFSGPAFTATAGDNTVYKALEIAQILLTDHTVDAVVIGAVDLAGGVENVTLKRQQHPVNSGAATLSFDQKADGWLIGEGAGAIVLQRAADTHAKRVYATIESVAVVPGDSAETVASAVQQALSGAGIAPAQIGYVEASAGGVAAQDQAEIHGLTQAFGTSGDLTSALGSVKANIGHTGAASGITSLIKAALALHRRFIAGVPNWNAPKNPEMWANSPFYVAQESLTWFSPTGAARYALVSGLGNDGTVAEVVLSDKQKNLSYGDIEKHKALKRRGFVLFALDGDDREALTNRLRHLDSALDQDEPLHTVAARTFAAYRGGKYAVGIVGQEREAIKREIQMALKGIPDALERGGEWQTPSGSYFTANPQGQTGGVAFVYPGAFNSYPDLARDWLYLFPGVYDHLATMSSDISRSTAERLLYPRHLSAPTRADIKADRAALANNPPAMMESGSTFALFYTYVMREVFKVKPAAAFGYSLGEGSMLWAMGVWRDVDTASERFGRSDLFTSRLSGPKNAVREAWGLPAGAPDNFWASYVLTASPETVAAEIARETRVYMTHVNTPNEVVIGGDTAACERIVARLNVTSVRAPFEVVIHNEAMMSEYAAFYALHHRPAYNETPDVKYYSAADYEPIALNSDLIARSIARVTCKPVDFPRLIHKAYQDGARVFIELGPGSTCTRWIDDTLGAEHVHLAAPVDNLRLDDHTALVKLLARLMSHRVPMDLSPLYDVIPAVPEKHLLRTITLGGESVRDVILSDENRRRFGQGTAASVQQPAASAVAMPAMAGVGANARTAGLRQMAESIRAQMAGGGQGLPLTPQPPLPQEARGSDKPALPAVVERYTPRPAIFDTERIDQFARKSIKACFGPEYGVYDNRRAPRIPNTDLMLLSRIVEVGAERLVTKTGSYMVAEYDVPVDMWFYRDNPYPFTPYSMLMEMALQPCGFLSAFMGPTLATPDIDFYFRNLDGDGTLHREVDLRGRTLVNKVVLKSSTVLQGIIIQKYTFDMMLDGESFYTGASTFGYFTMQALSSQAGLDMGKPPQKWHEANPDAPLVQIVGNRGTARNGLFALPVDQLAFVDQAQLDVRGGKAGLGYIYATSNVDPSNWFFKCHFHEDPVMPGSLGLETISQAIQAYALQADLGAELDQPHFENAEGQTMVWKYRGQVLGDIGKVDVEVHITGVRRDADGVTITADASLWKRDLRIYEFKNVAVRVSDAR